MYIGASATEIKTEDGSDDENFLLIMKHQLNCSMLTNLSSRFTDTPSRLQQEKHEFGLFLFCVLYYHNSLIVD